MESQADRRARLRIMERFATLGRKPRETAPPTMGDAAPPAAPQTLEQRVAHLEAALEALQDQLHRESQRRDHELADLRHQLRPEELARELSEDARRRGL